MKRQFNWKISTKTTAVQPRHSTRDTEAYYCLENRECTESSHLSSNNDNVEISERYNEVDLSEFRNIAQADRENMATHELCENTERANTVTAVQCTNDYTLSSGPRGRF